jgi:YD repeat-containing protein
MCRRVALRSSLRIVLVLLIGIALLPAPFVSMLVSAMGQGQGRGPRTAPPRPGKPEGAFPDLDDVTNESSIEREPQAPIPSTIRSHRNSGKPWDGRRVGDPPRDSDHGGGRGQPLRSHARRRMRSLPLLYEDQFIQNFFTVALARSATYEETLYWNYQLRAGYNESAASLKLTTIELGRTLFESAAYAARNRDAHGYVYDLYKTYLMREPDAGGWSNWEGTVGSNGREYVRRGFEESSEFASLLAGITLSGPPSATASSLLSARVDPRNQPGNGMLARDAAWRVPLLSLPGRNGLDLGLALSYSSMVWTRSGPYIYFDEDNGFPSSGFRLGFPTVQRKLFDAQTGRQSYLMITAGGHRVELRQVGTSNIYDAADSSYLRLTDNGSTLLVHSTDGTKLSFSEINGEYRCVEIKDRNGNYITVNNNALGHITSVVDTLGRVINFNYDGNDNLISITQAWNGQPSHQWVSFGWSTRTMQSSFSGAAVVGIKNGDDVPVITQVTLNDTSSFTFEYTNSLQVSLVKKYFDTVERNATSYTYETPGSDVPHLISSSVSAQNWTGVNGVPSQVTTQYSVAGDGACVLTAPDGTIYKEYYGAGWQRGLTTSSEIWSAGVRQKWITTAWTQDNTSVGYEVNPRVTETNVYDAGGNRRRTVIDYGAYAAYGLPYGVHEYAADGSTEIRQTFTDYNLSQAYLDRRIIGLVSQVRIANGAQSLTKITYDYDDPARLHGVPAAATHHDVNYNLLLTARGNVTAVSRWDVDDIDNATKRLTNYTDYYNTGTPISTTDAAGHQSNITYGDSFSDNLDRHTFAYPTTITDAGNSSSYVQYNFDFGATTRTQSPAPAGQSQGAIQTMTYNDRGQLERITTTNTSAYKRFWYGANYIASYATVNNVVDEAYAIQVVDGLGRVIGAASNHPGSNNNYSLVNTIYDQMGQASKVSNPTEVNSSWQPDGDDVAGFYYTQQTYDWKGRPLITTNPDGTTREASYAGCGCAGGEVVTLTDEGTIDGGVAKRRQQKIYSDVLGRALKTEILNWQGGSVYSATVNTYNARDQITQVRQYAGAEGSGTYQDTTLTYDGYGRLKTKHVPEQSAGANTIWDYNADDTIQKITDGRGVSTNYAYDQRHLLTGVTYTAPPGSQIPVPGAITYAYDAAGNRTFMSDGAGATSYYYDSLSRLSSESRTFTGFSGTYALSYSYNLANALTVLSIPFRSQQIGYNYDAAGRLSGVTGSGFTATQVVWPNTYTQNVTSFASNITYRAWGGRKSMTYGNTTSEQIAYNSRLQPTTYTLNNMNYQNTNVCCSYPTYSTMTWTFDYYNDGRVKTAWDSTDDWFDRAYKYDHAGRLKEASTFRRARGLAPFPSTPYPDPYYQNITYDAFNHTSRTGLLYTGEPSDVGTWVNNRRTGFGWQYDADGNTTVDPNFSQTFDAAGKPSHSVSFATVGDGIHYPYQPQLDITQTYDGTGAPGKRVQISRQPDMFDNEAPPTEDTQTTYYLRSTVLGGASVVELNGPGSMDIVNIYAGGQRIARDLWGNIGFEHMNPVTGSRINSAGHSSYRNTARDERDSFGAEIPTSNPYPSQSYVDYKFGEQLYIEGGDPFDYSTGREIDGIPVSEAEFQRRVQNGSAVGDVFRGGRYVGSLNLAKYMLFSRISITFEVFQPPLELDQHPELWPGYYIGSFTEEVELSGPQTKPNQNSSSSQNPFDEPRIERTVLAALGTKSCIDFANTVLGAQKRNGLGTLADVAKSFFALSGPRFTRTPPPGSTLRVANPIGRISTGTAQIYALGNANLTVTEQMLNDADNAISELFHLASRGAYYSDSELANAVHNSAYAADAYSLMSNGKPLIDPRSNIFDPAYIPDKKDKDDRENSFSRYFHAIQQKYCTSKPGFERGVGYQP